MSNTVSGREVCFFNGGGLAAFCERGCCDGSCCSTTTNNAEKATQSLIGVIAALMFIFFVICITYLVLRHRGYCPTRTGDPVKPIILFSFNKKGKGKKSGKGGDDKPSTWDQKHKDSVPKDTRGTQTETYKKQPGDGELFSKGKWPLVTKATNIPKNKNAKAVGTQTVAVKNNAKANNEVKVDNTVRALPGQGDDVRNTMITPTAPVSTKATDNLAGSRSASFVSPENAQRNTERQNTIDLLNDFTRQVMKD